MPGATVGFMIASACLGLSGNIHEACSKAAEAGVKQTDIEHDVNAMEKDIEYKADVKTRNLLGEKGMGLASGGIFIMKAAMDKSVKFNLPTLGLCDKANTEIGTERSELVLLWGF